MSKENWTSSTSRAPSSLQSFIPFWKLYFLILFTFISLYLISDLVNFLVLNVLTYSARFIGVSVVLVHLSWLSARAIRKYSQRSYVSPSNRAILITGCDSGFGNRLVRRLDAFGFHVYAGCLFPSGESGQELISSCSKRLKVVKLDVTSKEEIKSVLQEIKESGLELYGLVNNAGISQYSMVEFGKDISTFEKLFEVNCFGLVRITKMCLPMLRKSRGRVVNMASMAGRISFSAITGYCMTKFAVRAFSDGLRREMAGFGVKVITIEPNLYRTAIADGDILSNQIDRVWSETDDEIKEVYGGEDFKDKFKTRLVSSVRVARPEIHEVIDVMEEACTIDDPDIFYRCAGIGEKPSLWILECVSDLAKDYILTGNVWKKCLEFFSTK